MDSKRIDTGDQPFNRRRPPLMSSEDVDDTQGHAIRRRDADQDADRRRRPPVMSSDDIDDTEGHAGNRMRFSEVGDSSERRRRGIAPEALAAEGVEDTEAHSVRTYPGVTTDDELDCRMPLPGEEDERLRRL